MRQIVLDTETTGLDIANNHRIIEIAGVELINRKWRDLGKLFKKKNISRKECILLPFKVLKKIVSD